VKNSLTFGIAHDAATGAVVGLDVVEGTGAVVGPDVVEGTGAVVGSDIAEGTGAVGPDVIEAIGDTVGFTVVRILEESSKLTVALASNSPVAPNNEYNSAAIV
jgi:hypothetical protein